jgi:hypothetical protein
LIVGTPPGKLKLIVSQRIVGAAPATLGVMLPKARSRINDRVDNITNLKLDFTIHLLIRDRSRATPF